MSHKSNVTQRQVSHVKVIAQEQVSDVTVTSGQSTNQAARSTAKPPPQNELDAKTSSRLLCPVLLFQSSTPLNSEKVRGGWVSALFDVTVVLLSQQ